MLMLMLMLIIDRPDQRLVFLQKILIATVFFSLAIYPKRSASSQQFPLGNHS